MTITFTAACPGCGHDCTWRETHISVSLAEPVVVRIEIGCDCST